MSDFYDKYPDSKKRYLSYDYHLKKKYGEKVFKVSLNGGFTCPNIDGTKGLGGCTYCKSGSGDFAGDVTSSIKTQFDEITQMLHKKWKTARLYIPYFQSHTNTYASVSKLKTYFEEAISFDGVVGLSIATRADCLGDEIIKYLSDLNNRTDLSVELGLQSIFDTTGERINRCHSFNDFLIGYNKLKSNNIPVCIHLINGLPGETTEMMLKSAKTVASLNPQSIKLHLLHVLKGTELEKEYLNGEFSLLSMEDYIDIIIQQLEVLPTDTVIQRLTGDGKREDLVGPLWSLKKFEVLNSIDREMLRRDTYQGRLFGKD